MGAELAVIATEDAIIAAGGGISHGGTGWVPLRDFTDEVVVEIELSEGSWILFGRVSIYNKDGDHQGCGAKLVRDGTVLDIVDHPIAGEARDYRTLQAGLNLREPDRVTLRCNTYNGNAWDGSIVAVKVDAIKHQ
jgi:hypothetical protein